MQLVWFKRDLRIEDHRALAQAAERGPMIPLYIVEPNLWAQPDMSARQWAFVSDAIEDLQVALAKAGASLVIRVGEAVSVLQDLTQGQKVTDLWSHEETGNGWSYQRDIKVADWCKANAVRWHEVQNHGVIRRLSSRNGWAKRWDALMAEPVTPCPTLTSVDVAGEPCPTAAQLKLSPDHCPERQIGGRQAGLDCLNSFLNERGENYRSDMSSPLAGAQSCSRLSPHLAWGTVSMREAAQASWTRQRDLKQAPRGSTGGWRPSMKSFNGRLHWHCHFMQKLEDEPRLEFENLHRAYDGLRPLTPDASRLSAWESGATGLPFLDACMRSLQATGWLNFRMRAMVTATASYHLWLDWRASGLRLARLFTDYEPGIHWSQTQMQSGTTGINTVRIYNPVKQGYDQDPTGEFTRRWVPELAEIPDKFLQEPWNAENAAQVIGRVYPERIVDHVEAARTARDKVWAVRRGRQYRDTAAAIQDKHGSRKSGIPNRGQSARREQVKQAQMSLPFGDDAS